MPKYKEVKQIIRSLKLKKKLAIKKQQAHENMQRKTKKVLHSNATKNYFLELLQSKSTILILGDGNLSFSSALKDKVDGLLYPTVYDTQERLFEKFPKAKHNLNQLGDIVQFHVDSTRLHLYKWVLKLEIDAIVFNFPHVGTGIKDQDYNIQANQKLISNTFKSIKKLNTAGILHVCITLKDQHPYTDWDIKSIARIHGFECTRSCLFMPEAFEGYEHRRSIGFKEGLSSENNQELRKCKTFIFSLKVDPINC
eukprot:NODE_169_length_16247_cov_0.185348.p7 type:complete len:253 gc:universal NODE_169_length_16247_cov_0.185348:6602-5844(-)